MDVRHGQAIVELDARGEGDCLVGHFALHGIVLFGLSQYSIRRSGLLQIDVDVS